MMERKVTALTVSDFGCLKATGYSNGEIEVENGGKMLLYWHQLPVLGLAFSVFQNVPILGSVSADRTVTFWQPKLGKWRVMKKDLEFLNSRLPGEKWILKGNHDYWWNTASKMNAFFQANGLERLHILHNNCAFYGDVALCGTRGWFYEEQQNAPSGKVFRREVMRLETSLKAAGEAEKYCFLHYPPLYKGYQCPEILQLLEQYQVKLCCYGHLHGPSHRLAVEGKYGPVAYHLVAADYVGFRPQKILE